MLNQMKVEELIKYLGVRGLKVSGKYVSWWQGYKHNGYPIGGSSTIKNDRFIFRLRSNLKI